MLKFKNLTRKLRSDPTFSIILPLILSLYLPSFLFSFSRSLITPVLPLYAGKFGVSYGLVGLVIAGEGIGMLIGDLPAGSLLQRFGSKKTMLAGTGLVALSTAGLFWAGSIPEAIVYRLIAGFGSSLYTIARHTFIANQIPTAQRGRAISLLGGIFRFGRFGGPVVGGLAAASFGLRVPFLFFGVSYLCALIIILIYMPASIKGESENTSNSKHAKHNYFALIRQELKIISRAGLGLLFLQMIRSAPQIIIPLYAADILGLNVETIGLILSISAAIDMTLFLPAGFVMDRFGRKYTILSSSFFLAAGILLIPISHNLATLILVGIFIGFGNGLGSGAMMTLGADLAPEDARGTFLGLWRLIGDTGSTSGPLIIGGFADLLTLPLTTMMISSAGFAAFIIFLLFVKETLDKKVYPVCMEK